MRVRWCCRKGHIHCAKHIIGAGNARVVYIEPHSKSLADRLHGDAVASALDKDPADKRRVQRMEEWFLADLHG